ncbi:hypothetical protein LSUB1_G000925 [Lachnellula subtilissima]|uniref:Uncharacterized protein n=1 Tax=Lachnellula subtilissima TaxID=602034 RepID=A0A8H8RYK2_9HELO|nr:hypothetical protein LSUB1_G000925 [Lachnellula subtilissima]
MAGAAFSTLDALITLCTSVPEWNGRLDELNGQIALRQIELARLEDQERPPTRPSLKNKGSTESLRPKDADENPFSSQDDTEDIQMSPFQSQSPKSPQNGVVPARRTSSSRGGARALVTPPPPKANSNPRPSPTTKSRQSSQPAPPTQPRVGPTVLRKRKTDSLASGESNTPKYRTRSMIIVYYDSAVQTAFEELVKFVSASRNAMRKGKMAAKMGEMRRKAELELEAEEEEDDDEEGGEGLNDMLNGGNLMAAGKTVKAGEAPITKLNYVSTRQMGPPRFTTQLSENLGSTLSVGMMRGYRRGSGVLDIFDELDKGLEWCQSQCEHAAHQFLRDGECDAEITKIKKKLIEVKTAAEKEVERLKKAEEAEKHSVKAPVPKTKSREFRSPHIRKEMGSLKDLVVDDMEVDDDDEGVDDMEPPPKLSFRRSGQV